MKKRKSFKDCIVKPGEKSPYANLLVDLAFKKAFDPDKPTSRSNLINLLNDLLEPQLKRPIKNVWTRNVAKNLSGSKESRTAIFDLHCRDDMGNLIEIEVQIREMDNFMKRLAFYASEMVANQAEPGTEWNFDVQPTYVIALTRFPIFADDRAVHRAAVTDLETGEQVMDAYNYTVIELSKVPFFIEKTSSDLSKWLFFFRYLNRLKDLPEELDQSKFQQLTESSKVSKFTKKEFEAYRNMYHKVWDHNALRRGFFKEFADDVNAKIDESRREIAKRMIVDGKLTDEDIAAYSGLSIEDIVVLRSQAEK